MATTCTCQLLKPPIINVLVHAHNNEKITKFNSSKIAKLKVNIYSNINFHTSVCMYVHVHAYISTLIINIIIKIEEPI